MPPRDSRRPDRVAEAVREEVATFLADGVKDPRVSGLVTVTAVEMTRDLAQATVFVSIYGEPAKRSDTLAGLQSAAAHLRSRIGRALRLRIAPEITFRVDQSVERAARIETLLNSLRPDSPPDADATARADD